MGVNADLRARLQDIPVGADPVPHAVHGEPAAGVGHVDAVRAGLLHDPGLLGEVVRGRHVAHHQEPGHVHAEFAGAGDVLRGDVRLGAVRGDPHRPHTEVVGPVELADGPDAGDEQRGEHRVFQHLGRRGDPLPVGVAAGPVGQAGTGQSVAVRHLDRVHAGGVERPGDISRPLGPDPMPDGMHAVSQRDVLDIDSGLAHGRPVCRPTVASRSAVRSAAEVMMSRLPAYEGR